MFDWLPPEWLAAVTSSTAVGILGFIVGTYYKAKVEKSIQHELDAKLEAVRVAFRKEEEILKADLRAKGEQIAALRSGALSGLASRHAAIDKRRLEAIDKVWASAIKHGPYKFAAKMTSVIKMEVALEGSAKQDAQGAKLRDLATVIWNTVGLDKVTAADSPDTERPFLPPLVWALFSAYRHVVSHPIAQLAAMRAGVGKEVLADPKPMLDLVKSALPHFTVFIDKFGVGGLSFLIDELEKALLEELQRSLHNPEGDRANLEQAAAILRAADKLAETSRPKVEAPEAVAAKPFG
jgi:hypothetical protein